MRRTDRTVECGMGAGRSSRSYQMGVVVRAPSKNLFGGTLLGRPRQTKSFQMSESLESKIKRLERDLEQPISAACRAETVRVLELLRGKVAEEKGSDL